MNILLLGEDQATLHESGTPISPEVFNKLGGMAVRPSDYALRQQAERLEAFHARQVASPDMPDIQRAYHATTLAAHQATLAALRH